MLLSFLRGLRRPLHQQQRLAVLSLLAAGAIALGGCQAKAPEKKAELMFWPPAPDAPRVQFLRSFRTTADVTGKADKWDELLYGKDASGGEIPFERPYGVRFSGGCIYVCDASGHNVTILDLRRKEVRILGTTGQVTLATPLDIAVADDGVKYVADTGHGAVLAFDASDKYAGKIVLPKLRPVSLAVRGNDLYIADMTNSKVHVVDRFSGKPKRTIGGQGAGAGQLGGAMGICLDADGNLYVNDVVGCRVQKFDPSGKFVWKLGGLGDRPGNFVRPKHMAIDSEKILYVVDNAFENIQMFNEQAKMLMFFGSPGRHPGAMAAPAGVAVSDQDLDLFAPYVHPAFELKRVIITTNNSGPNKISVYGLGALKPGKSLSDIASQRIGTVVGFSSETSPMGGTSGLKPETLPADGPATQGSQTAPGLNLPKD